MKAESFLNIISSDKPYGKIDEDEVKMLQTRIRELEAENIKLKKEWEKQEQDLRREFEDFKKMIFEELKK